MKLAFKETNQGVRKYIDHYSNSVAINSLDKYFLGN